MSSNSVTTFERIALAVLSHILLIFSRYIEVSDLYILKQHVLILRLHYLERADPGTLNSLVTPY
jgi:hypothetical protein